MIPRAQAILERLPAGRVIGAEIGVHNATLSRELLRARHDLTLIMVDPWVACDLAAGSDRSEPQTDAEMARGYERARKTTMAYPGRASIIRARSVDAAHFVPDASLDFVFIDANHTYEDCAADIAAWTPKVKMGGLVSGHDYDWPGVMLAVNQAFRSAPDVGLDNVWRVWRTS